MGLMVSFTSEKKIRIFIYIYIYIEREREREREGGLPNITQNKQSNKKERG